MAYEASVLADSISPAGHRLTTMLVTYPRFVHSEHLRHRSFSYSVASSRALPTQTLLAQIMSDPVMPVYWGKYQKGMGAKEELTGRQQDKAAARWLRARDDAVSNVQMLLDFGRHHDDDAWDDEDLGVGLSKELVNRILEPWMWVTCVTTGTDSAWANFFWLRCHPAAQPEIRRIAEMMEEEYLTSKPKNLRNGSWHTPFVQEADWNDAYALVAGEAWDPDSNPHRLTVAERYAQLNDTQEALKKVSAARCARTSYLTHDGEHSLTADLVLFNRLLEGAGHEPEDPMHLSPLEHVATPVSPGSYIPREEPRMLPTRHMRHSWHDLQRHWNKYGNLEGWLSMRYLTPDEDGVEPYQRRRRDALWPGLKETGATK